jgi:hypothetical protein
MTIRAQARNFVSVVTEGDFGFMITGLHLAAEPGMESSL